MNMKGGILLASILTAGGPPTALGAAGTVLFTLSKKAFGRGTSFGTTDQPDGRLRRVFRQCVGNVDPPIALADFPQFSPCLTSVSMARRDFLFLFSQPLRPTRRAQSSNLIPVLRPPQGVDQCPEQVIQDSPFGFHPAFVPPEQYGLHTPYDAAVDIGVRWERNYAFYWWTIQPDITKQEFRWGLQDEYVLSSPSSMRLMSNIYIMDRGDIEKLPDTYLQYAKSRKSFLPRDEEAYRRFVRAVVERYDGDGNHDVPGLRNPIRHWQIDNEPQIALSFGWSGYAELLRMGYDAIKEADREAKVVMGGATGWPPASSYLKYFDRDFLPILEDLAKDRT